LHVEDLLAGQLAVRCGGDLERAAGGVLPLRREDVAEGRHVRLVDQQLERTPLKRPGVEAVDGSAAVLLNEPQAAKVGARTAAPPVSPRVAARGDE
jgi:hypothetical protein